MWYNEVKKYNFESNQFQSEAGHFTQLVWINSKKLGVGLACGTKNDCYVVANYDPSGNYGNQYSANVKRKESCK